MRIFLNILGGLMAVFLLFLMIGTFSSEEYMDEDSIIVRGNVNEVYSMVRNVNTLPDRREDIESVQMLGLNDFGLPVWRQNLSFGGYIITDFIEDDPENRLVFRIKEGTLGVRGTWAFEFIPYNEDSTQLKLQEHSVINDVLLRSLVTILGRDVTVRKELQNIKKDLGS